MTESDYDNDLFTFFSNVIETPIEIKLLELVLKGKTNEEIIEWYFLNRQEVQNDQA